MSLNQGINGGANSSTQASENDWEDVDDTQYGSSNLTLDAKKDTSTAKKANGGNKKKKVVPKKAEKTPPPKVVKKEIKTLKEIR